MNPEYTHKSKVSILLFRCLLILDWCSKYAAKTFSHDMIVALILTVMLIPQSLAYSS